MSELQAQFVKRGYWINEARGSVMGQTITTDTRTGTIIVALLALLTSLGMSHLWHIIAYSWHQIRADGRERDGLFRQQQVLLRTLPSPSSLVADSFKIWFAWRRSAEKALLRTSLPAILALLYTVATIATSILSSYVAVSSDIEVLIDSPHCAMLNSAGQENYVQILEPSIAEYASKCSGNGSLPSQCHIFSRPNVLFSTQAADCPFNKTICSSAALAIDSDYVDVGRAFGLNIAASDNIHYRKRSVCSILSLEGRTSVINASSVDPGLIGHQPLPGETFSVYEFGGPDGTGYTFGINLYAQLFSKKITHGAKENSRRYASFQAIPELQVPKVDVSIRLTRTNSVLSLTPIDDPMFSAHKETVIRDNGGRFDKTHYSSDSPGTMMGCTEQYQFCLGSQISNETCTQLGGRIFNATRENFPKASDLQLAIIHLFTVAATFSTVVPQRYKVEYDEATTSGVVNGLPNDQWIKEVQGWNAIAWAGHQIVLAEYAIGPIVRDRTAPEYSRAPENEGENSLCGMQKMRKPGGFVNINVFGLTFIVILSSIITVVDITLLRFIGLLKRIKHFESPRLNRWMQDGVFNLQRYAYEAHGEGIWSNMMSEVPITVEPTKLPDLPSESASPSLAEHATIDPKTTTIMVSDTRDQE